MKSTAISTDLREVLYFVFFGALLFAKGIGLYDGQPAFKILLVLGGMGWIGKILITSYTKKEWIMIVLLLLLSGVTYLVSGEKGLILYAMMVTGSKNVPVKRIFQVGCAIWCVSFLGMTWLNALHVLEPAVWGHERLGLGMVIRYGLGYSHPNVLSISYLVLAMFVVYLLKDKYNVVWFFGLMSGNALIFLYSLGNTGMLVTAMYLVLALYWRYRRKLSKIEKVLLQLIFPLCLTLSIAAPLVLQGRAFEILNKLLNTRLNLAKYFLTLQPVEPLGTRVAEIITNKLTMDNSYVNLLVTHGYITTVVVSVGYLCLIYHLCKQEKGAELCVVVACLVAGLVEPFLFNTSFKNLSLIFMGDIIWGKGTGKPLLTLRLKEWLFHADGLQNVINVGLQKLCLEWKKILLFTLALMAAGMVGYYGLSEIPERLIIPQSRCDYTEYPQNIYLENAQGEKAGDYVIGYTSPETEMHILSPNAGVLEYIRGIVIVSLTCGMLGMLFGSVLVIIQIKGNEKHVKNIDCK